MVRTYWLDDVHWLAGADGAVAARIGGVRGDGHGRGTTGLGLGPAGWRIVHEHLSAEPATDARARRSMRARRLGQDTGFRAVFLLPLSKFDGRYCRDLAEAPVPCHIEAYVFSLSRLPDAGVPVRGFLLYHANVMSPWHVAIG